jgi:hypothetical protein
MALIVSGAFALLAPVFGIHQYAALVSTFVLVAVALFIGENLSRPPVAPYRKLRAWFSKPRQGSTSRLPKALFDSLAAGLAGAAALALSGPAFLLFGEESPAHGELATAFGSITGVLFVCEVIWPTKLAGEPRGDS